MPKNDQIVAKLKTLGLVQHPPRVRTVFVRRFPVRLSFPWVSIGYDNFNLQLYAFFHNVPWRTLEEAPGILKLPSYHFHTTRGGAICIGGQATEKILDNTLTPSDAFWLTDNNDVDIFDDEGEELTPERYKETFHINVMSETDLPGLVLLNEWDEVNWRGFALPEEDNVVWLDNLDNLETEWTDI